MARLWDQAERDLAAMQRRLMLNIEKNYIIGMANLHDMEPLEYARQLDNEKRQEQLKQTESAAESLGRALRGIADAWKAAAEGLARGFQRGAH